MINLKRFTCVCTLAISARNFQRIQNLQRKIIRFIATGRNMLGTDGVNILGIETSCDDTGAAIVNDSGEVLGEGFYSQTYSSIKFGGVVPSIARRYHAEHIEKVVNTALEQSCLTPSQLTAVATTVKPGFLRSLFVGVEFGKDFALKHNLPFIPIHHMEAHALTVRIQNKVEFPFVVLLVSGGHCLLAVSHAIDHWTIVGQTVDSPPGCVIDRVARRMKLKNVRGLRELCGGKAIEEMAKDGDPCKFTFCLPLARERNANFSFSGFHSHAIQTIIDLENQSGIEGGRVVDEIKDLCASFQHSIVKHIVRRTHIGLQFIETFMLLPKDRKTLVISGGVGSNGHLRQAFENLCRVEGYRLLIPPPKLCTDNGIMVAWNGLERWRAGKGVIYEQTIIKGVTAEKTCPLGPNISSEFNNVSLSKPIWTKI